MQFEANAKINLTLDITGRDGRGYHLLSSLFAEISLSDTVTLEPGGKGITLECDLPYIPTDERNLCRKAAEAFLDGLSVSERDFRIGLVKRIPVCAGLGGGSSDAAAVIKMLCAYFSVSPDSPKVLRAAACVGADVPFFLKGGLCLAEGIGDCLTPLPPISGYTVLVAKTTERASTPDVYRLYDSRPRSRQPSTPAFLQALREGNDFTPYISNHLTDAAASICPSVRFLKEKLLGAGALASEMSGSGSAVYGLFPDDASALNAKKIIDADFCEICRFV